jgi:hypothetical protein
MLTEPVLAHLGLTAVQDIVFRVDQALTRERSGENQIHVAPDSGAEHSDAVGGILFREETAGLQVLRRHEIARLCPVVADVASWGDWKAKEIFRKAGEELGQAGVAVIRRLGMEQDEFVVVPFGGVFRTGELVLGAFRNTIQEAAPKARVVEPRFEPAVGAVLMALDSLGVKLDTSVMANVGRSSETLESGNLVPHSVRDLQ